MAETNEDILLSRCLAEKVEAYKTSIASGKPYVWALRLSLKDFDILEAAIRKSVSSHGGESRHLVSERFAPIVIIYLAEWYKRFYKGSDTEDEKKVISFNSSDLERLFDYANIDKNTFVYNASKNPDKTSFRWLESLQVLGGFAIQAELKKDEDTDRLLSKLCRIFHGEELDLNDLNDRNRAVAFQQSIQKKHSLYEYLDCILDKNKEFPFSKLDVADNNSPIHFLIERIERADKLAKKEKFDFEWIVSYSAKYAQMVRRLKIKLKPELIGGGLKQYIGYDRLSENWGIDHPEEIGRLSFSLRFKSGNHCVQEASFAEPLFQYHNTGFAKTGFAAINMIDEAVCTDIPVQRFDTVELAMKYDETIKTVQTLKVDDYIQLYNKSANEWSSRKNSQASTAVVFSSAYHLANEYAELPVVYAHFRNRDAFSEDYCWCIIYDKVVLTDSDGVDLIPPFFNRNGLYQVVTKRYLDTIKYQENLYAIYEYRDIDEEDEDMQTSNLPVLFGKDGLMVLHYESRTSSEGKPLAKFDLEWMQANGHYVDWNKKEPEQGPLRLRVTVQGIVFMYKVYYVPFLSSISTPTPIWRDFEHSKICTALNGVEDIQDEFKKLLSEKEPATKRLQIGAKNSHILIDVYRPVILRELSQKKPEDKESNIIKYYGQGDDIHIPLINCHQFSIRDFSEKGVHEYNLDTHNTSYYSFPDFDRPGMAATVYTNEIKASDMSEELPLDYLKIYIAKAMDNPTGLYAWDYKNEPVAVMNAGAFRGDGIVFQSLKDNDSPRDYSMPVIKKSWGKAQSGSISTLSCFKKVTEHKTYYFLFEPLIKCVATENVIRDILLPLIKERDFRPTEQDEANLYRFALEFHFDWMLLSREKWESQILEATSSEDEALKYKQAITTFFLDTPKCTDEREKACLEEFLKEYWAFNSYPKVDPIAEKALKLILGVNDALHGVSMKDFLKQYDVCRYKFIEMSKVIVSTKI